MKIVIDIPEEQIKKSLEESKYIHEDEGEKGFVASKPIVYLYPTQTTEVEVKLGNPEKVSKPGE